MPADAEPSYVWPLTTPVSGRPETVIVPGSTPVCGDSWTPTSTVTRVVSLRIRITVLVRALQRLVVMDHRAAGTRSSGLPDRLDDGRFRQPRRVKRLIGLPDRPGSAGAAGRPDRMGRPAHLLDRLRCEHPEQHPHQVQASSSTSTGPGSYEVSFPSSASAMEFRNLAVSTGLRNRFNSRCDSVTTGVKVISPSS